MRRHHIVGSPCRMQCHAACVLQAWFTLSDHIVAETPPLDTIQRTSCGARQHQSFFGSLFHSDRKMKRLIRMLPK